MASRSPEAAGDGWGHDETEEPTATAHRDPATGPPESRQRHLRARVAELEAELDRSRHRVQRVVDEYEALLDQEADTASAGADGADGPLARLVGWLRD